MDLDSTEVVATEEVVEATPIVTETVTEEVVETPVEEVVAEEVTEATVEEVKAETVEAVEAETPELIIFDANEDFEALTTKTTEVLDRYEIPAEVQAVIDVYKTKAELMPSGLEAYKTYGNEAEITSLLERQSYLDSATQLEDGRYRPNTDKFVETITDPVVLSHLRHDVLKMPSDKYQGVTAFEELIADTLANDGESVGQVLHKYDRFMEAFKNNAMPNADVPEFIPERLQEAYYKLSRDDRNEVALLDATDDYDKLKIENKVANLELIQQGIEGQKYKAQQEASQRKQIEATFVTDVNTSKQNFFNAFRDEVTKSLTKEVQFSTDPKLNGFLANQQVALLTEALDPSGESARQALTDVGIRFDYAKATQLLADTDRAAVELAAQKRQVDANGNPLNKPAFNRALQQWTDVGRNFQAFAKDIIDQEARLVSTGTAEAVKNEVAKIKVAPKARVVPQGAGVMTGKPQTAVPAYGTNEWRKYQDDLWGKVAEAQRA